MSVIIILVIVILLCSISGGVGYWKREDLFGTGEDDDGGGSDTGGGGGGSDTGGDGGGSAALAFLGESCSVNACESPLVCNEYSMKCANAPVTPPSGDSTCDKTACNSFMRDWLVDKNWAFDTDTINGICAGCPKRGYRGVSIYKEDGVWKNVANLSREGRFNEIKHQ